MHCNGVTTTQGVRFMLSFSSRYLKRILTVRQLYSSDLWVHVLVWFASWLCWYFTRHRIWNNQINPKHFSNIINICVHRLSHPKKSVLSVLACVIIRFWMFIHIILYMLLARKVPSETRWAWGIGLALTSRLDR